MGKNKKGQGAPAESQVNLFELFDLGEVEMTVTEKDSPSPQEEQPRDYEAERLETLRMRVEEHKRDLELAQYMVSMEDVEKLPFTMNDESLIRVYCVGRDVELTTGDVVTISGFLQTKGGKYIEALQPGEDMLPPGTALDAEPNRRLIHVSFLRGVLLDGQQLLKLIGEIPQLGGMAKSWPEVAEEESTATASPTLPEGWTVEDVHFLVGELDKGPLLVADTNLGIPTIHSSFGAEVTHCGFGLMRVRTRDYELSFDAGGAMQRTPSGKGWTRLIIEGKYDYDTQSVRDKLMSYLLEDIAVKVDEIVECAKDLLGNDDIEEQVRRFTGDLGQFCGTEAWHRHPALCPHIVLLTDGARYVAEHGGEDGNTAYWLFDAIASYQGEAVLKRHAFQTWKLVVSPPDKPGPEQDPLSVQAVLDAKKGGTKKPFYSHRHASLICTNGNDKELVRQEIEMTDFLPVGELMLYASVEEQPDVSPKRKTMIVLLPSEY